MSAIFISGTGTDVGKTFVGCGLIAEIKRRRRTIAAFKPLVSGFNPEQPQASDPGALLAALGESVSSMALDRIAPWRYRAALAPDMAAEAEAKSVDFDAVVAYSRRATRAAEIVIIEGVGGVMSPIAPRHTVLDWITALDLPVLFVTGTYLGAQSHALTALAALRGRDIRVCAVVVSETPDSTVDLHATARSLIRFLSVPVLVLPRRATSHLTFVALADLFCCDAARVR